MASLNFNPNPNFNSSKDCQEWVDTRTLRRLLAQYEKLGHEQIGGICSDDRRDELEKMCDALFIVITEVYGFDKQELTEWFL